MASKAPDQPALPDSATGLRTFGLSRPQASHWPFHVALLRVRFLGCCLRQPPPTPTLMVDHYSSLFSPPSATSISALSQKAPPDSPLGPPTAPDTRPCTEPVAATPARSANPAHSPLSVSHSPRLKRGLTAFPQAQPPLQCVSNGPNVLIFGT